MTIEYIDWSEARGFNQLSEAPKGALLQFSHDGGVSNGIVTSLPPDKAKMILGIGGILGGLLIDPNEFHHSGPFIDVGHIAEIALKDPGRTERASRPRAFMTGDVYKDLEANILYMYGSFLRGDIILSNFWICLESASTEIVRGDSFLSIRADRLIPITREVEVRRAGWREPAMVHTPRLPS